MFLQGLSAQLGRVLPSQRGPWKPGVQRQEKVPGLFTQVPPLRHSAGERRQRHNGQCWSGSGAPCGSEGRCRSSPQGWGCRNHH